MFTTTVSNFELVTSKRTLVHTVCSDELGWNSRFPKSRPVVSEVPLRTDQNSICVAAARLDSSETRIKSESQSQSECACEGGWHVSRGSRVPALSLSLSPQPYAYVERCTPTDEENTHTRTHRRCCCWQKRWPSHIPGTDKTLAQTG